MEIKFELRQQLKLIQMAQVLEMEILFDHLYRMEIGWIKTPPPPVGLEHLP
jgi:hypothetical protein